MIYSFYYIYIIYIILGVQDNINPEVINLELRDDYLPQWFELHEALGLKRGTLEYLRDTYEKDPSVCMYEATRLWFEQGDPKPSWAQIAYVLRYKLLDPVRADRIERNHGLAEHPHLLERPRKLMFYNSNYLIYHTWTK